MTKDELEKEAMLCVQAYLIGAELREKSIKELEKRISVLLSCKNCPDNKGGFICQKEYENKCLAQKIQYIEELKEENAELKEIIDNDVDKKMYVQLAKKAELSDVWKEQLDEAKEIITALLNVFVYDLADDELDSGDIDVRDKAEQFLKEVEENEKRL